MNNTFGELYEPFERIEQHPTDARPLRIYLQTPEDTELEGFGLFTWLVNNLEHLRTVGEYCRVLARNPEEFLEQFILFGERIWCSSPINRNTRFHVMLQDMNGNKIADSVMDDGNLGKVGTVFSNLAMCVFYLAMFMTNRGRDWEVEPPTFSDLIAMCNMILNESIENYGVTPPSSDRDHANEIFQLFMNFQSLRF